MLNKYKSIYLNCDYIMVYKLYFVCYCSWCLNGLSGKGAQSDKEGVAGEEAVNIFLR